MRFIFRPNDARPGAPLGGKAAALAALHGSGLPIPAWFVVLPMAFDASLTDVERRGLDLEESSGTADNLLALLTPAPSVTRELDEALAELCPAGEPVAVRSSAIDEDGKEASFAGQLESFLSVAPPDVCGRISAVWRSAFSGRVQAYRRRHGLPGFSSPPAVLIQRMIHAQAAGVAFGVDPVTGRPDLVVVSAVHGLGTALVGGECDADTWHVDASGGIRQIHSAKKSVSYPIQHGDVRRTDESNTPPCLAALDDGQVGTVARLVRRTGEILGRPQDIEWAIEDRRIFLLQSRPVTAVGSAALKGADLRIWDNSNIVESYNGVTTPLTFSFARRAYEGVYRQFCHVLAVPKAKIAAHDETFRQMLGLIRGRIYYNLLNWYRVLALLPGFTLNRRFMEQMMGVREELPDEVLAELHRASASDRVRDAIDVAFSLGALAANHVLLPIKVRRFYSRLDEALAPSIKPLDAMSPHELRACFCGLEAKLLRRWDAPLINDFFAMVFHGVLRRLLFSWSHDSGGTLHNDLLCGEGGMVSAEPARRIRELAELASPHPRFVKLLRDGARGDILDAMDAIPGFKTIYQEYLAAFGERCFEELKLESLTLHDDPLLLFRSVGRIAGAVPSRGAVPNCNRGIEARKRAEQRMGQALAGHPLRWLLLRWVLRHARARVRDRENLRFERTRVFGRVRRIFVELGRRLQELGQLAESRDVFFLEVEELLGAAAGTRPREELKELVIRRQAEFAAYRAEPPPPSRVTTRGSPERSRPSGPSPSSPESGSDVQRSERRGLGCCPGVVRGIVRNVADPRGTILQAGEIVVAERTDPGWIMLFPAAAGLLVERGSLLSHSAIVAREMGIPAIVAIDGLTRWLRDGDRVEFDGSTGIVRRFD